MVIAVIAVGIVAVIFAINSLKWKISTLALAYYIEKNQYKTPDEKDMRECTGFVGRNMFKDVLGRLL